MKRPKKKLIMKENGIEEAVKAIEDYVSEG